MFEISKIPSGCTDIGIWKYYNFSKVFCSFQIQNEPLETKIYNIFDKSNPKNVIIFKKIEFEFFIWFSFTSFSFMESVHFWIPSKHWVTIGSTSWNHTFNTDTTCLKGTVYVILSDPWHVRITTVPLKALSYQV